MYYHSLARALLKLYLSINKFKTGVGIDHNNKKTYINHALSTII